jgi:hydroxyethylthiazole kinase
MVLAMIEEIKRILEKIRKTRPLVLNFTNFVTPDFIANALLAIGAAPLMTSSDDELEELIKMSSSINMNIGTLDPSFINRCCKVLKLSKELQKPIVLDPVGAGSTNIRSETARELISGVDIVRGNASEIISLDLSGNNTFGVEANNAVVEAKDSARKLALQHQITVVISGPTDFITDGKRKAEVPFGSSLMPYVTGMGCTLTAVIAAFRSVENDSFVSAVLGTEYFGLCGQLAETITKNPGTFRSAFIDALYQPDFAAMRELYVK